MRVKTEKKETRNKNTGREKEIIERWNEILNNRY